MVGFNPTMPTTRPTVTIRRPAIGFVAAASAGAAAIHVAVFPAHADVSAAHAVAFAAAALLQAGWALAVMFRPDRLVLRAGIAIQGAIAAAWLLSRTVGLPLLPDPWVVEPIGLADAAATGLAVGAAGVAALLLRPAVAGRRLPHRLAGATSITGTALVLALTTTAMADGLAHDHRTHGAHDQTSHDHTNRDHTSREQVDEHHPSDGHAGHEHDTGDHAPGAHDDEPPVALDDDTQATLDRQMAEARDAVDRHPTSAAAATGGYRQFGNGRSAAVAPNNLHFVNRPLLDGTFDPARPESIMYTTDDRGGVATGLAYVVRSEEEPDGFAGPNDHWHTHRVCLRDGMLVSGDLPADRCADLGGTSPDVSDIWMLHVWVAPGWENPDGVFAHHHPRVNPDRQRRSAS